MFERRITIGEVLQVVAAGQIIEDYPEDKPYPSHLLLGLINARPIHVVSADNHDDQETIVITAYEPEPAQWDPSFRTRIKT